MKNKRTITGGISVAIILTLSEFGTGSKVFANSASTQFTTIDMVNSEIGWAAGQRTVWYTNDGGLRWHNVGPNLNSSPHLQLNIDGIGQQNAWLGVTNNDGSSFSMYYTSDAGRSWVKQNIHDTGTPLSMRFSDQKHGWFALLQGAAAGSEAEAIYLTDNGGVSWKRVSVTNLHTDRGLPFGGDKTGVTFIDEEHGWATGYTPVYGKVYLYQTTNGGHTWHAQNLPIPMTYKGAQFTSYPPMFFNTKEGIIPVVVDGAPLAFFTYRTTNAGKTWIPTTSVATVVNGESVNWDFISMNTGFVTDGIRLLATNNGGRTWNTIRSKQSLKDVAQLDFTTAKDGWALMTTGLLFHTMNGGHTWIKSN